MPQIQLDALIVVAHQLPEIAKQLKIANELKAIELKLNFHGMIDDNMIDNLIKGK